MDTASLENKRLCTQCSEEAGVHANTVCDKCGDYLCVECTKAHQRTKLTKDHLLRRVNEDSGSISRPVLPEMDSSSRNPQEILKSGHEVVLTEAKSISKNVQYATGPDLPCADNILASSPSFCGEEEHANIELTTYCADCNHVICELCRDKSHQKHRTKPINEAYRQQFRFISELSSDLRKIDFNDLETQLTAKIEEAKKRCRDTLDEVDSKMDTIQKRLVERRNAVHSDIQQKVGTYVKEAEEMIKDTQKLKTETCYVLKEFDRLKNSNRILFITLCSELYTKLQKLKDRIPTPTELDLEYNSSLSGEECLNTGPALECKNDKDNGSVTPCQSYVSQYMEELKPVNLSESTVSVSQSSFYSEPGGKTETTEVVMKTKGPGSAKAQLKATPLPDNLEMQVLKEVGSKGIEDLVYAQEQLAEGITRQVSSIKLAQVRGVSLEETGFPAGKLLLFNTEPVRRMVNMRLETWDLQCTWGVENGKVVVRSLTKEDCEKALEILNDAVQDKCITLPKGTVLSAQSDTWQTLRNRLTRNYGNQVHVEVLQELGKVVFYATCSAILKDVCDTIRIYVRKNQVKTITMRYDESVVWYVFRHKKKIQGLQDKLSQAKVRISPLDATSINVTGTLDGIGEAVKAVYIIATKLGLETDENRFDSTEEKSEDELRFSDDEKEELSNSATASNVRMSLSVGQLIGDLGAVVFLEGGRMLYIVKGDIIQLPAEALVNPADGKMKHDGGLAKVLVRKGGHAIQEECTDYVQTQGPVPEGQVFCSTAGSLACAVIIHAVGPRWKDGNQNEPRKLAEVVNNCLHCSSRKKLSSVALPAISAGSFKFPLERATDIIVKQISEFVKNFPTSSLREIYLCDMSLEPVNAFTAAVRRYFGVHSCITSPVSGNDLSRADQSRRSNAGISEDPRTILFQTFFQ